jgi:hypothetical protein
MDNTPTAVRGGVRKALNGRRGVAVGVGAAVVVAGAALAPVALRHDAPPTPAPPAATQSAAPDLVEFHSPIGNFSLSYPADWERLTSSDPQVPLVVANGPHSLLVRVVDLPTPVGARELPAARPLTDKLVLNDTSVKLAGDPTPISLSGLPGYRYVYTFADQGTGLEGAHAHLFLFSGTTMVVLVFQSLPADAFQAGADTFDQIANSFRTG